MNEAIRLGAPEIADYLTPQQFATAAGRPTCKVGRVLGENGARIYPKGCIVRNFVTVRPPPDDGVDARIVSSEDKFTKTGFRKQTVQGTRDLYMPTGYGRIGTHLFVTFGRDGKEKMERVYRRRMFLYDTGAQVNSVSRKAFLAMLNMTMGQAMTKYRNEPGSLGGVGGFQDARIFRDIPTYVSVPKTVSDASAPSQIRRVPDRDRIYNIGEHDWYVLNGNSESNNLLGVAIIDKLRKLGVRFSFRDAVAGTSFRPDQGHAGDGLVGSGQNPGPLETHLRGI